MPNELLPFGANHLLADVEPTRIEIREAPVKRCQIRPKAFRDGESRRRGGATAVDQGATLHGSGLLANIQEPQNRRQDVGGLPQLVDYKSLRDALGAPQQ